MGTKQLAIRGVAANWLSHFVGLAMTFFVTPILLNGLGDARYGIWSIVISITGYYGLVDLGIGTANVKYIAQFDTKKDDVAVRRVLATALWTYAMMALVVVVVSVLMAALFPTLFGTGGQPVYVIFWVVLLVGMKVAVQLFGLLYRSAMIARKRFDCANVLAIGSQVAMAVCVVLIIRAGGGLLEMAVAMFCVGLLTQASTYYIATRFVDVPRASLRDFDRNTRRTLFRFGFLTMLSKFTKRLGTNSGGVIIGLMMGPAAVAYYAVGESLCAKCVSLGKAVSQVTMPIASQFDAEQRQAGLVELAVLSPRILLAMGCFFATVLCVLGHSFIALWISPEYAQRGFAVFCVLGLGLVVRLPGNGIHSALVGMGRVGFLGRLSVVEALATVFLGVMLTTKFGIVGMAWAICLPQMLTGGLVLPVYLCRSLDLSIGRYFVRVVFPAALSALPGLALAVVLLKFYPACSLMVIVSQILIVAAVASMATSFGCLDSATRKASLKAMLPQFRRSRRNESVPGCITDEN